VTEHSQGSTTVMGIANLAMLTGNLGRPGVGVNPLRGQNNVQGACDMGSFPHELPATATSPRTRRARSSRSSGAPCLDKEPGLRIPNMLDAAVEGTFKGLYIQGEDILQSDPDTRHVSAGLAAMECVIVQDLFLNETANYAHVFLPGSTFLEKDGTFTNAERRINRVRKVMQPRNGYADWEVTMLLANAMGAGWTYTHPSQIMDEIAATTPTFAGVSYELLEEKGSVQWPCNELHPEGTPIMHVDGFVRGKGRFIVTEYIPTDDAPARASRSCSPPGASCRNTTSARRRGAPRTSCGTRRTSSRSTPTTPRSAASRTATASASPRAGRDDAAGAADRPRLARRGLHHLPSPRDPGQRGHHRVLGLGDQLPGIQGDRGAGVAHQRPDGVAARLCRVRRPVPPRPPRGRMT
jgi:formate dehydrogenase major subunit